MAKQSTSTAIDPALTLQTLKEADETILPRDQDIRGRDVIAKDGEKIGKVDALFVDEAESKIRYLRIESGGFLGIGEKKFLLPIDAISSIDQDHVHVDQTGEKIAGAPVYDPSIVSSANHAYYGGLFGYYGYSPYWMSGYMYPYWW
ncbi:MAG: PRC-barrel domain-containing protein [Opitutaceae bacterium]